MCVCVSVRLLCLLSPQRMLAKRSGEGFPTHLKRIEVCLHASSRAASLFFSNTSPSTQSVARGRLKNRPRQTWQKPNTARTRARLTLFAHFFFCFPRSSLVVFPPASRDFCTSCFSGFGYRVWSQGERSPRAGAPMLAWSGAAARLPLSLLLPLWQGAGTFCSIVLCTNEAFFCFFFVLSRFVWQPRSL